MFRRSMNMLLVAGGLAFFAGTADAVTREDPLRPPGYAKTDTAKKKDEEPERWLVNEILHSEGRRLAIVNNITVQQGDLVNGARVIAITADQVTLKYKDKIIKSRLGLVPVKRLKTKNTGR